MNRQHCPVLLFLFTCLALVGNASNIHAQYFYRQYTLDAADHELDKAAWTLYRSSNQLDYAEAVTRNAAQATAQQRTNAIQQNAKNQSTANRIAWQAQLLDQSARINAANAQKLADARATLAAESRRVQQASQDAEKGLAALLAWRDQIAKRHADNQASFQRITSLNTLGGEIVSKWTQANLEREAHLNADAIKVRDKSRELEKRAELVQEKLTDLKETSSLFDKIEASQENRTKSQAESLAALKERREALGRSKAALDALDKKLRPPN